MVLASSDREICHLVPGRGDSKSISTETAGACGSLSRPLGAGCFFASRLSGSSVPLFYTRLSKSSLEQTHLAPPAYPNANSSEFVRCCLVSNHQGGLPQEWLVPRGSFLALLLLPKPGCKLRWCPQGFSTYGGSEGNQRGTHLSKQQLPAWDRLKNRTAEDAVRQSTEK